MRKKKKRGASARIARHVLPEEAFRINENGRKIKVDPGRLVADQVLGRLRVSERTVTIHLMGEYDAELTYRAR